MASSASPFPCMQYSTFVPSGAGRILRMNVYRSLVDKTLSLLYSSAVARGLPHHVTRNLYLMTLANSNIVYPPPWVIGGGVWNGQLPPGDPKYQPPIVPKPKSSSQKTRECFGGQSLHALSDLIGMAEASGGVLLGRLQRQRRLGASARSGMRL
ncbi:hypothetical protein L226DRAFT_573401 [Lentinus tigrinus ALCF2SS1-7]|uniref:Uncharacterized protein n=1 Tax=Lentinus tigrinus ALCF2SS1-6 TaxID=1328759 RepID=A0A5C2S1I3_9APHY|nr:hypothetical protein L227DRAFT_613685 [Lentinus tigrinus ALCF2SS1-6]RPD72032.1 hypothetical protein L226DRAFT_573401 [Lentinus tigrinus ALCF2SS1-7]